MIRKATIGLLLMLVGLGVVGGGMLVLWTWPGWLALMPSIAGALAGLGLCVTYAVVAR